jgi:hypothetical protein
MHNWLAYKPKRTQLSNKKFQHNFFVERIPTSMSVQCENVHINYSCLHECTVSSYKHILLVKKSVTVEGLSELNKLEYFSL